MDKLVEGGATGQQRPTFFWQQRAEEGPSDGGVPIPMIGPSRTEVLGPAGSRG